MAHARKVVRSVTSPCGLRCVDLLADAGAGYGWASYRRDPEDSHGWRPDGLGGDGFPTAAAAQEAARADVPWLEATP